MTENIGTEQAATEQVTTEQTTTDQANIDVNQTASFIDQVNDPEIKSYIEKAGYKDIQGLAKSAMHLEKKLGSGAIEQNVDYKLEDYGYEVPEGYETNEDRVNPLKEIALKGGVKPETFKEMAEFMMAEETKDFENRKQREEQESEQVINTLKEEWGNKYEDNLQKGEEVWSNLVDEKYDGVLEKLDSQGKIAIAKIMYDIGQKISEPKTGKLEGAEVLTKETAQAKIDEIMNNPQHPYNMGDPVATNEMLELFKVVTDGQI